MTKTEIQFWLLPVLLAGIVFSPGYLESTYQERRQVGWRTVSVGVGEILVISFDQQGRAWIGARDGVQVLDGEASTTYELEEVRTIAFDERGRAWIGTAESGLSVFDGRSWITYEDGSSGLADNRVNTIAFDTRGRAWIGTEGEGLQVFDGESWASYNTANSGLAANDVRIVAVDADGHAWVASRFTPRRGPADRSTDRLNVFDGQAWRTISTDNSGLVSEDVRAIAFGEDGRAWIGTSDGLSIFDGEAWSTYYRGTVNALEVDEQGRGWIGTALNGVLVLDGGTRTAYNAENSGLAGNRISALASDGQGQIGIVSELPFSLLLTMSSLSLTSSLDTPTPVSGVLVHLRAIFTPGTRAVASLLILAWLIFLWHRRVLGRALDRTEAERAMRSATSKSLGNTLIVIGVGWVLLASAYWTNAHIEEVASGGEGGNVPEFEGVRGLLRCSHQRTRLGPRLGRHLVATESEGSPREPTDAEQLNRVSWYC